MKWKHHMPSYWHLLLVALLLPLAALSLLPATPVQAQGGIVDPRWTTFTTADGLAGNLVQAIWGTPDGILWFVTFGGVSRYDPATGRWQAYTTENGLGNDTVWAIWSSPEGILWFGTSGGVSRYAPAANDWDTFTTADGLADNLVQAIWGSPEGILWFGTDGGVSRYDPAANDWDTFTSEDGLADNSVEAIWGTPDGILWFGTEGGVSCYAPAANDWDIFTTEDGLADNYVHAIWGSPEGILWFGTGGGVSRYDPVVNRWDSWTYGHGLTDNCVYALWGSPDGTLWFGTNDGVSAYEPYEPFDPDVGWWQHFTAELGSGYGSVLAIWGSPDGTLWFGTRWGGVSRYDPIADRWHTFTTDDDLARNLVLAIWGTADGILWFGTSGGVSRYAPAANDWDTFTTDDGLADNFVKAIWGTPDGILWFGTEGGVSRYDPAANDWDTFTTDDGLADNSVDAIWGTPDGILWFGTEGGVSRYDPVANHWRTFTAWVEAIWGSPDGILWFGTVGGVSRYDPAANDWDTFTTDNGLADNSVEAIWGSPDGILWFGTRNGVSRYDPTADRWDTFTTEDGLADNWVHATWGSPDGILWFGTVGGGVSRYDGRDWRTFQRGNSGLAHNNVYAIAGDSRGNVLFGTEAGLTSYTPRSPQVALDQVLSLNDGKTFTAPTRVVLKHTQDAVCFDFSAHDPRTKPRHIVYRYKLEGRDEEWQFVENILPRERQGRAEYYSLKPGRYTFTVAAINRYLDYSDPVSVDITVLNPPIWTAPWFIVASIIATGGLGIGGGLLAARIRQRRRARQRRENPYSLTAITDPQQFFGRQREMERILGAIAHNHVFISGERRIGKTSLLRHAERRLRGLDDPQVRCWPIFVALEGTPPERFYGELMQAITDETDTLPEQLLIGQIADGYSCVQFRDDLEQVLGQLADLAAPRQPHLILCLDELDMLLAANPRLAADLRGLLQSVGEPLRLLATGIELKAMLGDPSQPFYKQAVTVELGPFTRQEGERLITEPVKGTYRYMPEAIDFIWAYSNGLPDAIQRLCYHAVEAMLDARAPRIGLLQAQHAFERALADPAHAPAYKLAWWGGTDKEGNPVQPFNEAQKAALRTALGQGGLVERTAYEEELSPFRRRRLYNLTYESDDGLRLTAFFAEWLRRTLERPQPTFPDLTIRIREAGLHDGRRVYRFELSSQLPQLFWREKPAGQMELLTDPATYLAHLFEELSEADWKTEVGVQRLSSIGASLYERLFPPELKAAYWLQIRPHVRSILIISDEPWIPWELVKPTRRLGDTWEEDDHLCERFALARWLPGAEASRDLRLSPMTVVVGPGLTYAGAEAEAIRQLPDIIAQDVRAELTEMYRLLKEGGVQSLHFACHGLFEAQAPEQSGVKLKDGLLRPNDISGERRNFGRQSPLVFLNACQTGRVGFSLTGLGGWAQVFLDAGIACFLGSIWSVEDKAAMTFALQFYIGLLDGEAVGEAVRQARHYLKERNPANPTWLAYSLYAHPLAVVKK